MCIIAIKPQGVKIPSREILENCFDNNDDGAGFMYAIHGKVRIVKGLMTFTSFMDALNDLRDKHDTTKMPIVFHFRIGTQGGNIPENTHPFPLTRNEAELQACKVATPIGIVHNGIISLCSSYNASLQDGHLSDTMIFIRDYLSEISNIPNWLESQTTLNLIGKLAGSKLTFLTGDGKITRIGDFIEDEESGCIFSNSTYQKKIWTYVPLNPTTNDERWKSRLTNRLNAPQKDVFDDTDNTRNKDYASASFDDDYGWHTFDDCEEIWLYSRGNLEYLCAGWELETDGYYYYLNNHVLYLNHNEVLCNENLDEIALPSDFRY